MNCTRFSVILASLAMSPVAAVPIVAVDMDPQTPGIQNNRTVEAGTSFTVEVVLDTDGTPIDGFEFDLAPGAVAGLPITATDITVNELWGLFPDSLVAEEILENGAGEAAGTASRLLAPSPFDGSGLLAIVTYDSVTAGVTALDLNGVVLVDTSFVPVFPIDVSDGAVTVTQASIPAPASALLLSVGLIGLGSLRWLNKARQASLDRFQAGRTSTPQ